MTQPEQNGAEELYLRLRLWAACVVGVVTVSLLVFDLVDDMWLGNHYEIPAWVPQMAGTMLACIFGKIVLDKIHK